MASGKWARWQRAGGGEEASHRWHRRSRCFVAEAAAGSRWLHFFLHCTLAMHFSTGLSLSPSFCMVPTSSCSSSSQNGVASAHLLFKMVAMHFDFCLFFSLLPLLAALFALSLLFCKNCSGNNSSRGRWRGVVQCERYSRQFVVDAVIYRVHIHAQIHTSSEFVMASAVHI